MTDESTSADAFPDEAPGPDPFGFSATFVDLLGRTLFAFLGRFWFRAEFQRLDRIPARGPVILLGVHRGFVPLDAMLILDVVRKQRRRTPRFLVHPGLLRFRPVAAVIRRLGGMPARAENAETVLAGGGVLGLFPEGVAGPFRLQRDAYRVGRFLSSDFLIWARRHDAVIVPFVSVGPAEAFPILARVDWRWWRRFTLWPFLPITPLFPWLPVPVPLPSKWHFRFLEPLETGSLPAVSDADGPARRELTRELRALLQRELTTLRAQRPSVYRGSISTGTEAP